MYNDFVTVPTDFAVYKLVIWFRYLKKDTLKILLYTNLFPSWDLEWKFDRFKLGTCPHERPLSVPWASLLSPHQQYTWYISYPLPWHPLIFTVNNLPKPLILLSAPTPNSIELFLGYSRGQRESGEEVASLCNTLLGHSWRQAFIEIDNFEVPCMVKFQKHIFSII